MTMMTTTQHLGHAARRARRVAPSGWRPAAAAFRGRGTTGVGVLPLSVSFDGSRGNTTDTIQPAVATVNACVTIKRSARHLGSRST